MESESSDESLASILLYRPGQDIVTMIKDSFIDNCYHSCALCDTAGVHLNYNGEAHQKEPAHRRRAYYTDTALAKYLRRSQEVYKLLRAFHGPSLAHVWPRPPILSYMFQVDGPDGVPRTLEDIQLIVDRFKWDAGLVSLELSLWKTACLPKPPGHVTTDVTSFMRWCQCGWKENKCAMRNDKLITVVMEPIVPFLGKPPKPPAGD
jgi:hypothetical protein